MNQAFCIEALKEAMDRYGKPKIFNSGQGSQCISDRFPSILLEAGVTVGMDDRGGWPEQRVQLTLLVDGEARGGVLARLCVSMRSPHAFRIIHEHIQRRPQVLRPGESDTGSRLLTAAADRFR